MLWCYSWPEFEAACWGPPEQPSIRRAAALFRERNRGSFFIWDYNRDSKGLPGIFKCRHDLGRWWCWLLTLLSVELQLQIYLQLLSDCFERFLCKAEPLEHAVGMAVAGKGLWYSWEQCDLHKGPVTTAWNPLHRSSGLGPRGSILPAVKKNGSVWLRAETLPIPNAGWKFWAWVSPVPPGEHNYCQQVSAKQGPAQGSRAGVSPMGTCAGDTRAQCWAGSVPGTPWLMALSALQDWLHQTSSADGQLPHFRRMG